MVLGLLIGACATEDAADAPPSAGDAAPSTDQADTTTTAPAVDTSRRYAVGARTEMFEDPSRVTMANGDAPELPTRTLPTYVLYPADGVPAPDPVEGAEPAVTDGPFPLIVFSHGFTGNGPAYQALTREWARAGYVVVAPTFPLSSAGAPGGPVTRDVVEQPADVSFLIDQMLAANADLASPYAGLVAEDRVGVAGHSLGGATTLGVTFSVCCTDERIEAAVSLAGLLLPPDGRGFRPPGPDGAPLLAIHGDADMTVAYERGRAAYDQAGPPKRFVTIIGGAHTPDYVVGPRTPGGAVVASATLAFFDEHLKDDPAAADRLVQSIEDHPGVARLDENLG
ncbi:hypothetical protein BH24ACT3_BH24ACT3_08230 [soil metagenome]